MTAIIAGVSLLAIAFMAVFFVKIRGEGSRLKVCEILQLDTESFAPVNAARQGVETEPQGDAEAGHTESNVLVMPGAPACDRIEHGRGRKPA